MVGARKVGMMCVICLASVAALGQSPGSAPGKAKQPFELRILLDTERDELAAQVINRSSVAQRISLKSLKRLGMRTSPVWDGDVDIDKRMQAISAGRNFGSLTWCPPRSQRDVHLLTGESIGLRFSFTKHDFGGYEKKKILDPIETQLKTCDAVKYTLSITIYTPGEDGKPVKGARLHSNALRIDRETLDSLKASRDRIESEAKKASEAKEAERTRGDSR